MNKTYLFPGLIICFSYLKFAIAQPQFPINYPYYPVKMDDKRTGWIIGFSAGTGCNIVTPKVKILNKTTYGSTKVNSSFLTDIQLGYNFNDLFEVSNKNRFDWQMPYSTVIAGWTSSIEPRYYFSHMVPSIFIDCSIGYGYWFYPFDQNWNDHYYGRGISFSIGGGYEIKKHLSLHFEFQNFRPINQDEVVQFSNGYYEKISDFNQMNISNGIRLTACYSLY